MLQQMLYPQWLNLAPDFRATNTREPSGRSENNSRKLAQFCPLAFPTSPSTLCFNIKNGILFNFCLK